MDKYKITRNKVEAANSTWSGQQYIKNGFNILNRSDIEISERKDSVKAFFRKSC